MARMMSKLLYDNIEAAFDYVDKPEVPNSITKNIKQPLREYQQNALINFIFYMSSKKHKDIASKHLLFHMATGSGKTNIIASSILYLYDLGYRDFIFFVNTNNIITKTKENLLNKQSAKYLFKNKIMIQNREVNINIINDTFDESKKDDINILFTTINKLHGDLETTLKENSITYSDFKDKQIVLIADEAHHLNAGTKTEKTNEKNWEQTTKNLLNINEKNILLEFTATQDLSDKKIADKYRDKILYDYPLKKFRDDKYSKDIRLISDNLTTNERMLQALMISEYRKIIAQNELNLSMKPVIMFKTVKTTDKIDAIFVAFTKMIEELKTQDIDKIFKKSKLEVLAKLEIIIDDKQSFVNAIKYSFSKQNCLVIHSKVKNKEEKLKYLNSLEDIHNPIRAIFAIDILNEGWDVLNLFDIVKLDEAKTTAKSTTSEAQLIGRGARYFPFIYESEDKYKRKFDNYPDESIKILEELYFHSINQSEYINAITKELRKIGLLDENDDEYKTIELKVKQSFLDDELYKNGVIYVNEQVLQNREKIGGISDYVSSYKAQKRYVDNRSLAIAIFDEEIKNISETETKSFIIKDVDPSLVRVSINKKEFFYFSSLKKYFVNLKSISEFIKSSSYLGDIEFTLHSTEELELNNDLKIKCILEVLDYLEKNILKNATTLVGSHSFKPVRINSKIPPLKKLKLKESDSPIHRVEEWYIFEPHGGTSEEMNFVEFIKANISELKSLYDDVKLIRNEKAFDIFSFDKKKDGAKFEPDFILMLKEKNGCYHQIFCEPKGDWAKDENDGFQNSPEKWKNEFLSDITKCTNAKSLILKDINEDGLTLYENSCYKIFGLPFYNYAQEHEFKEEFRELIF
jgi:type III restriction enzyme